MINKPVEINFTTAFLSAKIGSKRTLLRADTDGFIQPVIWELSVEMEDGLTDRIKADD